MASLRELDPEDDKASIGIAPVQVGDKSDFRSMLIWMVMRLSGTFPKGFNGAVIASFPAVDVLPVALVLHGGFGNPIFLCEAIRDRRYLISCVILAIRRNLLSGLILVWRLKYNTEQDSPSFYYLVV